MSHSHQKVHEVTAGHCNHTSISAREVQENIGEDKTGGSLGCSDHSSTEQVKSIVETIKARKVNIWLFRA